MCVFLNLLDTFIGIDALLKFRTATAQDLAPVQAAR